MDTSSHGIDLSLHHHSRVGDLGHEDRTYTFALTTATLEHINSSIYFDPISQNTPSNPPPPLQSTASPIHYSYGLHKHCSSVTASCASFPTYADCSSAAGTRTFCSLWRTASFTLSLSIIFEFATLITFLLVLLGGKQRRSDGWLPLDILIGTCVVAQVVGWGLVTHLYRTDAERFFDGWQMGKASWMCVVSWASQILVAVGVTATCLAAEEEAGYELIPDPPRGRRN
jgi:hypothetical protein